MKQAAKNTDREIWRQTPGDYYSPSIHVTAQGNIAINVGGLVIIQPIEWWHKVGKEKLGDIGLPKQ